MVGDMGLGLCFFFTNFLKSGRVERLKDFLNPHHTYVFCSFCIQGGAGQGESRYC